MVTKNTAEECVKGHKGKMGAHKNGRYFWCNVCQSERQRARTKELQSQGLTAKGKVRDYVPTRLEKFESVVVPHDTDECIPWPKWLTAGGYGSFYEKRKYHAAHRISHELYVGPIPDGYVVDHTCHNESDCTAGLECLHRSCINPKHLEAITPSENTRRGKSPSTVASRLPYCGKGHMFVEGSFYDRPYKNGTRRVCRLCAADRWQKRKAQGYTK